MGSIYKLAVVLLMGLGAAAPVVAYSAPEGSCATEALNAGRQALSVTSSGVTRSVLLFVPPAVSAHRALPLVIDLHGSGGNGEQQAAVSRLPQLGGREGFVVAEPSGGVTLPGAPDRHYWNIPGVPLVGDVPTPPQAPDDVQFISDTIDAVAAHTCIDPRRVYVTGMSGGARMASLLACRLSTRIAAIAPVSGLRAGAPSRTDPSVPDPASCQPQRAVPIVTFHGTADTVNPFNGDSTARWHYSVPAALKRWVALDHCAGAPHEQRISAHVTLVRYAPCRQHAEIWLYRTDAPARQGGGHVWPGSVMTAAGTEINASELMWRFFQQHPLP